MVGNWRYHLCTATVSFILKGGIIFNLKEVIISLEVSVKMFWIICEHGHEGVV